MREDLTSNTAQMHAAMHTAKKHTETGREQGNPDLQLRLVDVVSADHPPSVDQTYLQTAGFPNSEVSRESRDCNLALSLRENSGDKILRSKDMHKNEFNTGEPMDREWTYTVNDGAGEKPYEWTSKLTFEQDHKMQFVLGEALYRDFFGLLSMHPDAKVHACDEEVTIVLFDDDGNIGETLGDWASIVRTNPEAYERHRIYHYYEDMLVDLGFQREPSKAFPKGYKIVGHFDPLLAIQQISVICPHNMYQS